MKRNIALIIAIVLIASTIISVTLYMNRDNSNTVVATVNGEKITKEDLYNFLVKTNGEQALNVVIIEKIVRLEAEKENIEVTKDAIQAEMDKMIDEFGGE